MMQRYVYSLAAIALVALGWFSLAPNAQVIPQPGPPVPIGCAYNTTPPTLTNGQAGWVQCDANGQLLTTGGGGGGGDVNITEINGAAVSNTNPLFVAPSTTATWAATQSGTWNIQPATSGGLSNYFVQPAASDNAANIKATAGQVFKITATNNSATVNYLRLYNARGFRGMQLSNQFGLPSLDPRIYLGRGIGRCVASGTRILDWNFNLHNQRLRNQQHHGRDCLGNER
jgi:hypothetical protein